MASLHSLGTLAVLLPAIYGAGNLAQRCRLPVITGYVLAGIVCGRYGLNILHVEDVRSLEFVEHVCLSIFALAAGGELHFEEFKRHQKQVMAITAGISVMTWTLVTATVWCLAPFLHLMKGFTPRQQAAVASLAGTLMIARSPASAIAVLKETEGKGPYCSLVMAVVVVKDVVVFILFAISLELSNLAMKSSEGGLAMSLVLQPFISLGASVLLGIMAGVMLGSIIQQHGVGARVPLMKRLGPGHALRAREIVEAITVALAGASVFWLAMRMSADSLLACVVTGVVTTNRRAASSSREAQEHLASSIGRLMPYVNTAFFWLAGASLSLGAFFSMMWVAALVWVARLIAIFFGSMAGEYAGGTPPELRGKVWQGMVTQAGVALGLARIVSARFPAWGPEFAAFMMSIIVMNLFTGPPLFRAAVIAAGEGRIIQHSSLGSEFEGDVTRGRGKPMVGRQGLDELANGITTLPLRIHRSPSTGRSLQQTPSPKSGHVASEV